VREHTYHVTTDIGLVRSQNEDSFAAAPPMFAVADGLGGHQAGEVASRIAIETLIERAPKATAPAALAQTIRKANEAIIAAVERGEGRPGMGTTVTAAVVQGTRVLIAHVGDSRAYLLRNSHLERLTRDHSVVADMVRNGTLTEEEARHHVNRSVITRALGSDPTVPVDTLEVTAQEGDRFLLCTDGLHGPVRDEKIADILISAPSPRSAADSLVDAAIRAGGPDNITAVVVDIPSTVTQTGLDPRRRVAAYLLWAVAALLLFTAAAAGTYSYAHSKAFLIDESGVVVVYRGIPDGFAGIRLKWSEQTTEINVEALPGSIADRLTEGIEADDLSDAMDMVAEFRLMASESATAAPSQPETNATSP